MEQSSFSVTNADLHSQYQAPETVEDLKSLLKVLGMRANTDIGQNFLVDPMVIEAGIEAAELTSDDTVLEVGPGLGILTTQLAQTAGQVISIELDSRLEPVLQAMEATYDNLSIVRKDVFKVNLSELPLPDGQYKVVANIPYQITSLFIRNLLTQAPRPSQMVLLVQKEVADRIVAGPGKHSVLSLSVQLYAQPEIVAYVPRESFYPAPAVQSAIIDIHSIGQNMPLPLQHEKLFFAVVKAGFAHKRKKLLSNLSSATISGTQIPKPEWEAVFTDLKLSETARAQELSLEQWCSMVDKISHFVI